MTVTPRGSYFIQGYDFKAAQRIDFYQFELAREDEKEIEY